MQSREIKFEYLFHSEQSTEIKKYIFTLSEIEEINMEEYLLSLDDDNYRDDLHRMEDGIERKVLVKRQYTGTKDKNGIEIYEGDILYNNGHKGGVVNWDDYTRMFVVGEYCVEFYKYAGNNKEVIGNIYQNPELLVK